MPELPEVQTLVDDLIAAGIPGRRIVRVRHFWDATIATHAGTAFQNRLRGKRINSISRRGKYILLSLENEDTLIVHLRMTGRFVLTEEPGEPDRHVHVVLVLDDGRALWFHDTRKFGRFYLTGHPEQILSRLGPEPLAPGFTRRRLADALAGRKRQIKPLLLDQGFLAGLGNIYVDEALWAARLHPLRPGDTLTPPEIRALHAAIRRVLRKGLKNRGTSLGKGEGNFYSLSRRRGNNERQLKVFRRTGEPCCRCRTPIRRMVVAQRSTHLCETCQR